MRSIRVLFSLRMLLGVRVLGFHMLRCSDDKVLRY